MQFMITSEHFSANEANYVFKDRSCSSYKTSIRALYKLN